MGAGGRTGTDDGAPREPRFASELHFYPVARAFLIALAVALAVVALGVELRLVDYAYERIGIAPRHALVLLLLSLACSAVNVPLARLRGRPIVSGAIVSVHGVDYVVPVVRRSQGTVLAVNLGGALIPVGVSVYLLARGLPLARTLAAVVAVTLLVHRLARPEQGVGIVVPIWIPPLAAAVAGLALGGPAPAGVAYVAGTLGALVGGDLLNLRRIGELGAPVASIGGAGTFDGVFLTGILAVLLA